MLLGAFFGYLALWGRSLWLPVLAHAFNNSVVAVFKWLSANSITSYDMESTMPWDSSADVPMLILSVVATAALLFLIKRVSAGRGARS